MSDGAAIKQAKPSLDLSTLSLRSAEQAAQKAFTDSAQLDSNSLPNLRLHTDREMSPYPGREKVEGFAIDSAGTHRRDDAVNIIKTEFGYELQITIADPFEQIVTDRGVPFRAQRGKYSLTGEGYRPSITFSFSLDKEMKLLGDPEVKPTYMDNCIDLDEESANRIRETAESRYCETFQLLERAADTFASTYTMDLKEVELFGFSGRGQRSFSSDQRWGGRMGRAVTRLMEVASVAAGKYLQKHDAPAIYSVLTTVKDEQSKKFDAPRFEQRFAAQPDDGLLDLPKVRITSPMIKDVDYYNLRVLKAVMQEEQMPRLERLLPDIVRTENAATGDRKDKAKKTRMDTSSETDFWAAAGRIRDGSTSSKDFARILASNFRGRHTERSELRQLVYEKLIREPKQLKSVIDQLAAGDVLTRDSARLRREFNNPVIVLRSTGRRTQQRREVSSDTVARGRKIDEKSLNRARLEALVGMFERINNPREATAHINQIKRKMGLQVAGEELQAADAQNKSIVQVA